MTANELAFFTVTGFFYDVQAPDPDSDTSAAQVNGLTGGFVTFTPRVPGGFTVQVNDLDLGSGNTGSTSISLPPIVGRVFGTIGENFGSVYQLCAINVADSAGIQLLANTSIISSYLSAQGIEGGDLIYDVTFDFVTYAGSNQTISSFAFIAPTSATTVCITDPDFARLPYLGR